MLNTMEAHTSCCCVCEFFSVCVCVLICAHARVHACACVYVSKQVQEAKCFRKQIFLMMGAADFD